MALSEVFPALSAAQKAVQLNPLWWIGYQTLGRAHLGLGEVRTVSICCSSHTRTRSTSQRRDANKIDPTERIHGSVHTQPANNIKGFAWKVARKCVQQGPCRVFTPKYSQQVLRKRHVWCLEDSINVVSMRLRTALKHELARTRKTFPQTISTASAIQWQRWGWWCHLCSVLSEAQNTNYKVENAQHKKRAASCAQHRNAMQLQGLTVRSQRGPERHISMVLVNVSSLLLQAILQFSRAVHINPADRDLWEEDLLWAQGLWLQKQRMSREQTEHQNKEETANSTVTVTELDGELSDEEKAEEAKKAVSVYQRTECSEVTEDSTGSGTPADDRRERAVHLPAGYVKMRDVT